MQTGKFTTAEIESSLRTLADRLERGEDVAVGEFLLREAADAISALTRQVEEAEDAHDKLHRVRQWAEAYPQDIFLPVSDDDLRRADKLLGDAGISMSAMHGHWARHIVSGIAGIVGADISRDLQSGDVRQDEARGERPSDRRPGAGEDPV